MKQWLQVEAKPNQRELVGLIKAVTVARPATSVAAASLVVALGSYIEKWKVQEEFLVQFLFVRTFLDEALTCLLANMKRERLSLLDFWNKYKA